MHSCNEWRLLGILTSSSGNGGGYDFSLIPVFPMLPKPRESPASVNLTGDCSGNGGGYDFSLIPVFPMLPKPRESPASVNLTGDCSGNGGGYPQVLPNVYSRPFVLFGKIVQTRRGPAIRSCLFVVNYPTLLRSRPHTLRAFTR